MLKIEDISFLISTRNNKNRLEIVYKNIRKFYKNNNIVIVSDFSNDDTDMYLANLKKIDNNILIYLADNRLNFAKSYNKAIELCPTPMFCFFHDDTLVSANFLENLLKHIKNKFTFSCFSTCEPPIFGNHSSLGKPIKNFGLDYKTLKITEFYEFSKKYCKENENKSIRFGGGFFMCGFIDIIREIGGFDTIFYPHFSEDSDLIHRLTLKGVKFTLSLDSLIYHLPSSTSRFSDEFKDTFRAIDRDGMRNFLRKWHVMWHTIQEFNSNSVPYKKVSCRVIISNCNTDLLYNLEPFFDFIAIDNYNIQKLYLENESKNTKFDLIKKFNTIEPVYFECFINGELDVDIHTINTLQYIINDADTGSYEISNFILKINKI
jgi:GT2 family glycosyltransferase